MTDVDVASRSIHLFGDIEDESTGRIIKGIQVLLAANKEEPINIYIHSDGGDAYSGLFLFDYISSLSVRVRTIACGKVFSAATLIFLAGDERVSHKNTVFMFHTVSTLVEGKSFDINTDGRECQDLHIQLCKLYADCTNITYKQWDRMIKHEDKYIRSDKALEIGIITDIIKE